MKKILIPVLSFAVCFTVIWKWTLGFSAFTIFSYTLNQAGSLPRTFPDLQLISQDDQIFHLKDKDKYTLVNFVYLDCPYVCHKVNNDIENIYHKFDRKTVPGQLEFVTISFDLQNDNTERIKKYRNYFGDDDEISGWTFALPWHTNQPAFDKFLHQLGIWKYTVPETGITNHSIYLYLVGPDSKIVKIFDPARQGNDQIIEQISECINEPSISSSF